MAIDVCSEISSPGFSPRISFSYDLNQRNTSPIEDHRRLDSSLLDSTSDFNFSIVNNVTLELSSADELFSNGKIVPAQIKKKKNSFTDSKNTQHQNEPPKPPPQAHHQPLTEISSTEKKKRLKEFLSTSFEENDDDVDEDDHEKPASSKSFWQFRRSSSLNFDTARGKSLIKSLHFLSRSNSTGSAPNSKQSTKETQKPNLQKQQSVSSRRSSVSSCSSNYYYPNNYSAAQRPCLRRNGSYGNGNGGVRISPVLNLPPPYISKVTISFFGFGSLFCSGKVKKKKK